MEFHGKNDCGLFTRVESAEIFIVETACRTAYFDPGWSIRNPILYRN
jgi:hypothetical protein